VSIVYAVNGGARVLQLLVPLLIGVCLAFSAVAQTTQSLTGRYAGFALSEGVVASLVDENGRVIGQYTDLSGKVFTLNGQRVGAGAQGQLERDGVKAFFQLETRPLGIQFLFIPAGANGQPDLGGAKQSALAREDVDVETLLGQDERESTQGRVVLSDDVSGFDLAEDYAAMRPRERELIRLFDHVQAHLTGRLCSAVEAREIDEDHPAVSLALERQQAGCSAIATLRDRAIASDNYDDFETRLAVQQELLATTMACDAGDKDPEMCQTAGAMNAAMFEQWRRAAVIYAEVADRGGTGSGAREAASRGPVVLRGGLGETPIGDIPLPVAKPQR